MNVRDLSAMESAELLNYLNEVGGVETKAVIQYVKCPYTRKFDEAELKYKEALRENPSGTTNYKQYEGKQKKALMLILQQIKNMSVDDILGTVTNLSAKLNVEYQNLLTDILTKKIGFNITSEELKDINPDTNVFKVATGRKITNIEDILPARVFQVKKEFERLISIVCVNYVKFFNEDGVEMKEPSFANSLKILAGTIPVVFDGYRYNDYYLLNDLIIFGDFKRGKTKRVYEQRYQRLKQDVTEFQADPKVANPNIMVPAQFELKNAENWKVFIEKMDKNKTYIIKSLDDNYEYFYEESGS